MRVLVMDIPIDTELNSCLESSNPTFKAHAFLSADFMPDDAQHGVLALDVYLCILAIMHHGYSCSLC